jgi:hypothetical protein
MYVLRGVCLSCDADNYDCYSERKSFYYVIRTTNDKNGYYNSEINTVVIDARIVVRAHDSN